MPAKKNRPSGALVVTMRDLSRKTGEIVGRVMEEQRPVIVRARSGFAAILQPVDQERINQLVLEHASDLIATRESSEQALAEGKTTTASALAEELGLDLRPRKVPQSTRRKKPESVTLPGAAPRVKSARRTPRVAGSASAKAAKATATATAKNRASAAATARTKAARAASENQTSKPSDRPRPGP